MWLYLAKRLLLAIGTLLVILVISYVMLRLAPGDPTKSNLLGSDAGAGTASAERNEFVRNDALRKQLHLDEPIYIGFYYWFKAVPAGRSPI